jgi:hypothetical protein
MKHVPSFPGKLEFRIGDAERIQIQVKSDYRLTPRLPPGGAVAQGE